MQMHIVINGEPRSIPQGQTVLDLLHSMQIDPARVAIELDRKIVKQPLWAQTALHPGATLEIVQFVGGG